MSSAVGSLEGRAVVVTGDRVESAVRSRLLQLARALMWRSRFGRTKTALEKSSARSGRSVVRAFVMRLDVTDAASLGAFAPAARDALGRLDVWVNNAGADILTGSGRARCRRSRSSTCCSRSIFAARCSPRGRRLSCWAPRKQGGVIINMSWDHVLTGMPGAESATLCCGEGRRARLQQVARALGRAARARERARAGLDRDVLRQRARTSDARNTVAGIHTAASGGATPRTSPAPPCSWHRRPRRSSPDRRFW